MPESEPEPTSTKTTYCVYPDSRGLFLVIGPQVYSTGLTRDFADILAKHLQAVYDAYAPAKR